MSDEPVIAIACGGTGGHFYPGVSIAGAVRAAGGRVVLLIGGHHMDEQVAYARGQGFLAEPAPAVRLPHGPIQGLMFLPRLAGCVRGTQAAMRKHGVRAALCMGSWASIPTGLAAWRSKIPLALHEGNATLGQANRFLSRWAVLLGLSFPLRETPRGTKARQVVVGMPIREAILNAAAQPLTAEPRAEICSALGLSPEQPICLVFGGSQGARAINEAVLGLLAALPASERGWQWIHLTGQDDNTALEKAFAGAGVRAVVRARDPEIHRFYQVADAVICRAGASTILELALLGKAPLMIPFPGAKENHQMANALTVMEAEGGWLAPESELTPARLAEHLRLIREEKPDRAAGIRKFARPDAARAMAAELLALVK